MAVVDILYFIDITTADALILTMISISCRNWDYSGTKLFEEFLNRHTLERNRTRLAHTSMRTESVATNRFQMPEWTRRRTVPDEWGTNTKRMRANVI